MTQIEQLETLAQEITDVLVRAAARAINEPDYNGIKLATCLLVDAQKYQTIRYPRAVADVDLTLSHAADKIKKWDAAFYGDR